MLKHVVVLVLAAMAGLCSYGAVSAHEAGFSQAEMWVSQSTTAPNDFSAAILAKNPADVLAELSEKMPDMMPFGSTSILGEEPFRISSNVVVDDVWKTFTVIFDTSDGSPFIGVNAFPGDGGGPTMDLCFQVGNSLSGNMPIKVTDVPFSITHTNAKAFNDTDGLLLELNNVPYVIKHGDTDVELNICFYNLEGNPVGPMRVARMELRFMTSTDIIFQDDFE